MQKPRYPLGALALVALIGASPADAAGWRYFDPQSSRTYVPEHIVPADDSSVWTFDFSGNVRHYTIDGTLLGSLAPSPRLTADTGMPLADGGAILLDRSEGCAVARVDAALRPRWQTQLSRFCKQIAPTRDGRYWVSNAKHLFLLDAEGRTVHELAPDAGASVGPFAATADGGVVAASGPVDGGGGPVDGGGTLTHYGRDGAVRWRWSHDGLLIRQVRVAADGGIVIAGVLSQTVIATGDVFVAKINANGTQSWSHAEQGLEARIVDTSIAGDLTYVATEGERPTLYRFDAAGAVHKHDVCKRPVSVALLPTTPDASPAFVCRATGPGLTNERFVRYGAAGETLVDTVLPLSGTYFAWRRADGRLLIRGSEGAPSQEYLLVTDADGRVVDTQPLRTSESRQAAGQWLDADGSTYLVTYADAGSREHRVSRVDANGALVWQRTIEQPILWRSAQVSVAAGQVCVTANIDIGASATQHLIECLTQADGALRWTKTISKGPGSAAQIHRTLDDRSMLFVHGTPEWHEVHRYDRDGNRVFATRHSLAILSASISANGRATLSLADDERKPQLVQYDAQGRQVFAVNVPAAFAEVELADESTAPDGSVVAFATTSDGRDQLWAITPNGQTAWTQDLQSRTSYGKHVDLARSDDALYVLHDAFPDAAPWDRRVRVRRHLPRDGTTAWAVESIDHDSSPVMDKLGRLAVSPAGDTVLVMHAQDHKLRARRHDAANGALAYAGYVACDAFCGRTDAIALDSNGNARAALAITGGRGTTAAIVTLPAPPARNIRVDQPGIAGAWWSPYANGEGIVIDYLPASRTFFAPWFTFSRAGGNDPAGQRWYVVQGTVPANATRVELPITESSGGNFDAAPTVQARIVGKVTVSFSDCNNGTMEYAFDAATNDAATGTITLSRLIPATESCLLADGTTRPGAGAAAPANGFDAGMSGSWFEQATSGQGLQFVVQPGGVFFAPWFTFDPTGPSDDPGRQRWFTIQGSLADARNGIVRAPIVQTIGGAFDSVPTNNMTIVGQANVTFNGCDSAKVDYRFDDTESAGAMRALAGTTDLIKIGGCTR